VICEYLDSLAPSPVLFPKSGPERWKTLVLGALADGILDAALLLVYEKRFRPEDKWHATWQQRQQAKIDRALDQLERSPPAWGQSPDYGHMTLACALGYLDFRHEGKWRAGPTEAGGMARPVRKSRAGLRGDAAESLTRNGTMLKATEIVAAGTWTGKPADVARLDYDRRTRRRITLTCLGGLTFLLDLAKAPVLRAGDGIRLEDGRIVAVEAAPEQLLEIACRDARLLARVAWHLGNRIWQRRSPRASSTSATITSLPI